MKRIVKFIKDWTLPIAMISGVAGYFTYTSIPQLAPTKPFVTEAISIIQPLLIFSMLFATFCKVSLHEMRPRLWHMLLVVLQITLFSLLSLPLIFNPNIESRVLIEAAMVCFICPTATAAAIVTGKLGGDAASITTYTIIINIAVAIVAPTILPIAHPQDGLTFLPAFLTILSKVFPLLICPLIAAWIVRKFLPKLQKSITSCKDLAFYLWSVALALAIAVTVKSIVHSNVRTEYLIGIAIVSLVTCLLQFAIGKMVGGAYKERICGGQALGQKNTVFAIWMGYTFLSPVTAVAGGFYSVWHNLINSYQLYRKRKSEDI